jgi:hypothetical protein
MTVQVAGPIGPFLDSVQQRQVECEVVATCEVAPPGPASEQRAQTELLRAIRELTASKMASNTLQFKDLSEGADRIVPEVIAASGLAQQGISVDNLVMTFGVDGRPPKRWDLSGKSKGAAPAAANVGVNLRVGGLNIKAGPGGVDAAGLARQVGERVKSTLYWYLVAGLLVVVIVGGVGLYLWHTVSKALHPGSTEASAAKWDGKTRFTCGGDEKVTITGVTAHLTGTAVSALGSCQLTLVNVDVTGTTAIEASGSAIVTVRGGKLNGSAHAVHALGNAKVTLAGTHVTGKTQALGAAAISGP